jgi:predicted nucleic acid-binding Zn ribbon protein
MPVYDFKCPGCGNARLDVYVHGFSDRPRCNCGQEMEKQWSSSITDTGSSIYPYTTSHITGSPIEIKSPSHLRSLERTHGVRLRDDAAFLTQEYVGYDIRSKKQLYKESSGVGMKGCWV